MRKAASYRDSANQLIYFKMPREEIHSCAFIICAFRAKLGPFLAWP